jgi:lysozyme
MISPGGLSLIRSFESFSPTFYVCAGGYKSIAYGHVVKPGEVFNLPLSPENGEIILLKDVGVAERAISRLIHVPLSQNQWDSLTSWTFNLGSGSLERSTLRAVINRQEYDEAPDQIKKWIYAGGRKLRGLVIRREIEARLFA